MGKRIFGSTWLLAAAIELLSWVHREVRVEGDLDPSFIAGLHMAADLRLDFGTEIVATYGPLGFLAFPQVIFDGTAVLSASYLILIRYALSIAVLWTARRSFPLYIAFPLAFLVVSITPDEELASLAFIGCCVALAPGAPERARPLALYGTALLTGLALLVKVNVGLLVLALSLITVWALPGNRARQVGIFTIVLGLWLVVLLAATGQQVLDFPEYLRSGLGLSSGYQTAQVTEDPPIYVLGVVAVMIGGAIAAAIYASRDQQSIRRAGLIAVVALFCFAEFKIGFVRYGHGVHIARFTAAMTLPWLALHWVNRRQRALAATAIVGISMLWFAFTEIRPDERLDFVSNSTNAVRETRDLLDSGRRDRIRAESQADLIDYFDLDPGTLGLLRDQSLHVEPWEAALAWAYELDWDPAPVFQSYMASTPALDQLNADHLSAESGPTRIFRRATVVSGVETRQPRLEHLISIDNRYAAFDAPAQTLATLCNYEALRTTSGYQVLGRTGNRCGPERDLGDTTARYGEPVAVPRPPGPRDVVIARIDGVAPSGIERLRVALFRGLRRYIAFDAGAPFQLAPLNAGQGLILRTAGPVDFPLPFALAPNADTITLTRESGLAAPGSELRLRFYAVRVAQRPQR